MESVVETSSSSSPHASAGMCHPNELYLVVSMIVVGISKATCNMLTVGATIPSGVLVPALVIGGLFGRAFGIVASSIQRLHSDSYFFLECWGSSLCIIPAAYAIVGSAAFLTGITRMTVCLAVIMLELTGGLEYLVPVIIGILAAKSTGEMVGVESTYDLGIEAGDLPYLDPKKEFDHPAMVQDICRFSQPEGEYVTLDVDGMTIEEIHTILEQVPYQGFPIVDRNVTGGGGGPKTTTQDNNAIIASNTVPVGAAAVAPPAATTTTTTTTSVASSLGGTDSQQQQQRGGSRSEEDESEGPILVGYISRMSLVAALREVAQVSTQFPFEINASSVVKFRRRLGGGGGPPDSSGVIPVDPSFLPNVSSGMMNGAPLYQPQDALDFSRYVDSSSIQVPPDCDVSRLLYVFKSLGLRHVLVTSFGSFQGIITKKDFITFIRECERQEMEGDQVLDSVVKKKE